MNWLIRWLGPGGVRAIAVGAASGTAGADLVGIFNAIFAGVCIIVAAGCTDIIRNNRKEGTDVHIKSGAGGA